MQPQVIPGADSFYIKGNHVGILISHGFNGTPQSVRYIGEKLAQFGFTIFAPRLAGHGTTKYDMETCTYDDWFTSLEKGYLKLKTNCSKIFVIGQSMGGTLALRLASKYKDIQGIITINPALSLPAFDNYRGKVSPRFVKEGKPDIKRENVHEITYEYVPIKAIHELQKLMDLIPSLLPFIQTPILGFKSIHDHVVPPCSTDEIMNKIGSVKKEVIPLQNSYHVATMDDERETIVQHCFEFIYHHISEGAA